MRVAEFMRNSSAIGKNTSIQDAEKILASQRVKILPVLNYNRLVGVVTRGDIARALPSDATTFSKREIRYWLDEVKVKEFMREPTTVTPDMDFFDVVGLAIKRGVYNFPVLDEGKFVGMIYEEDIVRYLADEARRPAVKIEVNVKRQRVSFLERFIPGGAP